MTADGISQVVSTFNCAGCWDVLCLRFTFFENHLQEQGCLDDLVGAVMRKAGVLSELGEAKVVHFKL